MKNQLTNYIRRLLMSKKSKTEWKGYGFYTYLEGEGKDAVTDKKPEEKKAAEKKTAEKK